LLVASARSATAQEHTRSLELAARLAQRPCISGASSSAAQHENPPKTQPNML
ncbi:hypothetical protein A2U01_0101286, partial [Trifolium medium]|nr:hypothetical protein [Trifolium medium]